MKMILSLVVVLAWCAVAAIPPEPPVSSPEYCALLSRTMACPCFQSVMRDIVRYLTAHEPFEYRAVYSDVGCPARED